MPRIAFPGCNATCKRRKVRCDCALPVCLNCRKGNRKCERPKKDLKIIVHSVNPIRASQELVLERQKIQNGTKNSTDREASKKLIEAQESVTFPPHLALRNPVVASLFRDYIDILAPWYDLNDFENLFGTVVPVRALSNAILFKALIAFAACHRHTVSGEAAGLGPIYHAACVKDLLVEMNDIHSELLGDYLAATCLLRSYEILNGDTRQQQHLLGAYSFAVSCSIDLTMRGLPQAGAWNYLREEITMGLESHRPVRISTPFEFDAKKEMSDDMWANAISHLLARVINFCFQRNDEQSVGSRVTTWRLLAVDVAAWKANRPATFDPFSTVSANGSPFPYLWLMKPWHVAGEQYFSVAKILLALYEPVSSRSDSRIIDCEPSTPPVRGDALRVCGLAYTNGNVAARVNAFGPLAFCGRYLSENPHREALIAMLQDFSTPTGWPVQHIIEDLQNYWAET